MAEFDGIYNARRRKTVRRSRARRVRTYMRVGVDATCWHNNRGYGRHARALLSALVRVDTENHYTFFLDAAEGLEALPVSAEVRLVRAGVPTAVAASAAGHRS